MFSVKFISDSFSMSTRVAAKQEVHWSHVGEATVQFCLFPAHICKISPGFPMTIVSRTTVLSTSTIVVFFVIDILFDRSLFDRSFFIRHTHGLRAYKVSEPFHGGCCYHYHQLVRH